MPTIARIVGDPIVCLDGIAGVECRQLPGYPGYAFGVDGSVWSCKSHHRKGAWRKLKPGVKDTGHLVVVLCIDGKRATRLVQRLILEAFIGPCPPGMEACHDPDRNPANCRLENLRWDTSAANTSDSRRHGTMCRGTKSPEARITDDQVREIRRLYLTGDFFQKELAAQFGVIRRHIGCVLHGERWAHIEMSDEDRLTIKEIAKSHDAENRRRLSEQRLIKLGY